ncbi:MAG TPA: hypothetical protein VLZ30_02650, partial [Verrucomicrobiae bacterium]|nr:hypothetical protein [Verrucomicrobiae bacterium]
TKPLNGSCQYRGTTVAYHRRHATGRGRGLCDTPPVGRSRTPYAQEVNKQAAQPEHIGLAQ